MPRRTICIWILPITMAALLREVESSALPVSNGLSKMRCGSAWFSSSSCLSRSRACASATMLAVSSGLRCAGAAGEGASLGAVVAERCWAAVGWK